MHLITVLLISHQIISFWVLKAPALAKGNFCSCSWHREHRPQVREGDPPGEVPDLWRKVTIMPVFKKGSKEDPGNYRPVSFIFIPGKVIEQLVLDVISKPVESAGVSQR